MSNNWNEDTKKFASVSAGTVKCSCGHSILMDKKKMLCYWCGNYVYKDKRLEFAEKLKRRINEGI